MLDHKIEDGVLFLNPDGELTQDDFVSVTTEVDTHIAKFGPLRGLIVKAESFPGWESFGALTAHLKFVKDHHHDIKSVAIVTNDSVASHFPSFASHFVEADIRHFEMSGSDEAVTWVCEH